MCKPVLVPVRENWLFDDPCIQGVPSAAAAIPLDFLLAARTSPHPVSLAFLQAITASGVSPEPPKLPSQFHSTESESKA